MLFDTHKPIYILSWRGKIGTMVLMRVFRTLKGAHAAAKKLKESQRYEEIQVDKTYLND